MIDYNNQRVGVFIDVQNMYYTARNLYNRKVNFGNIVKEAVGERQLIRAIAYVVSTKTGENQPFFDALANIGIETKEKELMEYYGGQKKADWDVGITVDAIKMSDSLDVIVLVSGDGDYIPLVEYLHSRGKIVEVVSFRETTSTRLVESIEAKYYTNLSENKHRFLIGSRASTAKTNTRSEKAMKSKDISNIIDGDEKLDDKPAVVSKKAGKTASKTKARSKTAGSRSKKKVTSRSATAPVRNDGPKKRSKTTERSTTKPKKPTPAPRKKKPLRRSNAKSARNKNDSGMSDNERALNN